MQKFNVMKCFDCDDMPCDLRDLFIENNQAKLSSGCYIQIDLSVIYTPLQKQICEWLLSNGATKSDVSVLIRYWEYCDVDC